LTLTNINDKFTDLCGNLILHNDLVNTFCEISLRTDAPVQRALNIFNEEPRMKRGSARKWKRDAIQGHLAHKKLPSPLGLP